MATETANAPKFAQFFPTQDPTQQSGIVDLQRRQMLAQALAQNAQMPADNEMAGNVVVKHSPLEYLVHALSGAGAQVEQNQANKEQVQLQGRQFANILGQQGGGSSGSGSPTDAATKMQLFQLDPTGKLLGDYISKQAQTPDAVKETQFAAGGNNPTAQGLSYGGLVNKAGGLVGNGQGGVGLAPGYAGAQAAVTGANKGAEAPYGTPIPVTTPDNKTTLMRPDQFQQKAGPMPGAVGVPPAPASGMPIANMSGAPQNPGMVSTSPNPGPVTAQSLPNQTDLSANNPGMLMNGPAGTPPANAPAMPAQSSALPADNSVPRTNGVGDINPAYQAAVAPGNAPTAGVAIQSPAQASGSKTLSDAQATNLAEAQKTFNTMYSNVPSVMSRLNQMSDASKGASSGGYGVNNDNDGFKQNFDKTGFGQFLAPGAADNNARLKQLTDQAILPELGPQLGQANVKGNKFVEGLANGASGIDLSAPDSARQQTIGGLNTQYVNMMKAQAATIRQYGGQAPSDADIDKAVAQAKTGSPGIVDNHRAMAQAAIKAGANPAKVQAMYQQQTGQPW